MERWKDKVAVVTGARRGIGKAIAKALVDSGLKVVGIARNLDSMVGIDQKFYPLKADVRNEAELVQAFAWILKTLGPVHVLINNAGIYYLGPVFRADTEKMKDTFDTNVMGLCVATREAISQMRAHNVDGHVIHINSVAGYKVILNPSTNIYAASKYAVTALTETLRQELVSINSRIKITSISPGATRTEANDCVDLGINLIEGEDVSDAVCYALGTPPHVQIHELTIRPILSPY